MFNLNRFERNLSSPNSFRELFENVDKVEHFAFIKLEASCRHTNGEYEIRKKNKEKEDSHSIAEAETEGKRV